MSLENDPRVLQVRALLLSAVHGSVHYLAAMCAFMIAGAATYHPATDQFDVVPATFLSFALYVGFWLVYQPFLKQKALSNAIKPVTPDRTF